MKDELRDELRAGILCAWRKAPEDSPMAHLEHEAIVDALLPIIEARVRKAVKEHDNALKKVAVEFGARTDHPAAHDAIVGLGFQLRKARRECAGNGCMECCLSCLRLP